MKGSHIPQVKQPRTSARKLTPELLFTKWGDPYGTVLPHFPEHLRDLTARSRRARPLDSVQFRQHVLHFCIAHFIEAVGDARDRVWVLDPYLMAGDGEEHSSALPVLVEGLRYSHVRQIRIISSDGKNELRIAAKREIEDARNPPTTSHDRERTAIVEWRVPRGDKVLAKLLHDRFAIVDDEFWHFGGDVGGAHQGITISSRGWDAGQVGAVAFFGRLWDQLSPLRE